jgi:capsular polysaccharide biosynthesis protein
MKEESGACPRGRRYSHAPPPAVKRARLALHAGANVMSLASALKRSWLLVLICVLACVGAGAAISLLRSPVYKADSQLFVGSFDVRSVAIPGFVTASQQLADAYSRLAASDAVVVPVARQLGLTPAKVRERLSSSNVPGSPVVRITAEGASRRTAVELARAASNETVNQVRVLTARTNEADQLLGRFKIAAAKSQQADARAARLRAQGASQTTILAAQTDAETAKLGVQTLANLYGEARANSGGVAQAHVVNAAVTATSDRGAVLQQLALLGAVAGLVAGAALAVLRERRRLPQG